MPATIDVELRYQPIGYRWAQNLQPYDAPEPEAFLGYFQSLSRSSSLAIQHVAVKARR